MLSGLVTAPALQTSGAAECLAFGSVAPRLQQDAQLFSDYKALCDVLGLDVGRMTVHSRTYGGVFKCAAGHPAFCHVGGVHKVRAHVDLDSLQPGSREWVLAMGNHRADEQAKAKVAAHQPYSDQLLRTMQWESKLAAKVCRYAGEALALWPSRRQAFGPRPRASTDAPPRLPLAPGPPAAPALPHFWQYCRGRWRCDRCLAWVATPEGIFARREQECLARVPPARWRPPRALPRRLRRRAGLRAGVLKVLPVGGPAL